MTRGRAPVYAALAALVLALPSPAAAHDVPADVTVQAFLEPEGSRLHLLVRAPLAALRDVDYPTRGPGYLDLPRVDASLRQAAQLWIADQVELYEDDVRLSPPHIVAVRVSLPSDRSFGGYEEAVAHLTAAPLPDETELYWSQGMLDVWFEYAIRSDQSRLSIDPGFARLGLHVTTVLRFLPPGGAVRLRILQDPDSSGSRRSGIRPPFASWPWASGTSSTGRTISCFCCAWSSAAPAASARAGGHGFHRRALDHAHRVGLRPAPDAPGSRPRGDLIAASIVYMALENIVARTCVCGGRSRSPSVSFTGSGSRSPSARPCSSRDPIS